MAEGTQIQMDGAIARRAVTAQPRHDDGIRISGHGRARGARARRLQGRSRLRGASPRGTTRLRRHPGFADRSLLGDIADGGQLEATFNVRDRSHQLRGDTMGRGGLARARSPQPVKKRPPFRQAAPSVSKS
jgi:hypothetical protein